MNSLETNQEKEHKDYLKFFKNFDTENLDPKSKIVIDYVMSEMKEIPIFLFTDGYLVLAFITPNNVYSVEYNEDYKIYLYPLYKFNKKLSLDNCKYLTGLLGLLHMGYNSSIIEYIRTGNYTGNNKYYYRETRQIENLENAIKFFPGKYDYDDWERIDNLIFDSSSLFLNKKEMKVTNSYLNVPVYITLQL